MRLEKNFIKLSDDSRKNILQFEDKYYTIDFLGNPGDYVKGGNGTVFKLLDEEEGEEFVIKFLHFPLQSENNPKIKKRILRFEREIEALWVAKENSLSNVIEIQFDGSLIIDKLEFPYYVMQKCDCNLKEYLLNPDNDIDIYQKVLLFQKILNGIKGLHEYKIFHRDIKHDNIFFIGNEPYVGDLGLADYRESEFRINERGELIGPTGWFSPEAINKYLVENTKNTHKLDCKICEKSEVFQLGKLFWYILQGNLPIGQILIDDLNPKNEQLFNILFQMLQYSKDRRDSSQEVENKLSAFLAIN